MKSRPRVVVLALDGIDGETIERHASALPELAKAFRHAREAELRTLGEVFLVSPWPCFASGVAVENHGIHAFRPLRSGTLEVVEMADFQVPTPFWETAVSAGMRACVLDVPFCKPPPDDAPLEGLRLLEWGAHPPVRPVGSFPRALASRIVDSHGPHPCTTDDPFTPTVRNLKARQAWLCEGVRIRERIIMDLLDQDSPDLLVAGFCEAHVAEHQFFNLDVPGHPWHDPAIAAALGESPLRVVYAAIDAAVGRILGRLPPDATVLVIGLGGLRVTYGGDRFLEDVLRRLGLTVSTPVRRDVAVSLWRRLPQWVRRLGERRLAGLAYGCSDALFRASIDWKATRAFALPWGYDGYLRINQRGREPLGTVAPGEERSALLDQIESVLGELTIAGTREPAVRKIVRPQETYPGRASGEFPDLMVLWKNDRPLDAVESPRVGRLENRESGPRAAHAMNGRGILYAWGPGIAPGAPISGSRDIDVAPTVLSLLGLNPPEGLDGRTVTELLVA